MLDRQPANQPAGTVITNIHTDFGERSDRRILTLAGFPKAMTPPDRSGPQDIAGSPFGPPARPPWAGLFLYGSRGRRARLE